MLDELATVRRCALESVARIFDEAADRKGRVDSHEIRSKAADQ